MRKPSDDPRTTYFMWIEHHSAFHLAHVSESMTVARPACGQSSGVLRLGPETARHDGYVDETDGWAMFPDPPEATHDLCEACRPHLEAKESE